MLFAVDHQLESQKQPASHYEVIERPFPALNRAQLKGLKCLRELEGWCSEHKALFLVDLVFMMHPKVVVEIGVWGGKSLIPMAYMLKEMGQGKVYGIDPWQSFESAKGMEGVNKDFWSKADHEGIYQGLVKKIHQYGLDNTITLVRSTSVQAAPIEEIDIIHIDGNHGDEASYLDVTTWVPRVRRGGMIIFDDVTWGTTDRAVNWLNEHCIRVGEYFSDSVWGVWVKP